MLPYFDQQKGVRHCLWAELSEPIHLKVRQCICHVAVDPCNVLDFNMYVVSHSKEGEGVDQYHHCLTVRGGPSHDVDHSNIVTMEKQVLPF